MFTFYGTIAILLTIISVFILVLYMHEMIRHNRYTDKDEFEFFGVEWTTPEDLADFILYSIYMGITLLAASALWIIGLPILIFTYRFKRALQEKEKEDD